MGAQNNKPVDDVVLLQKQITSLKYQNSKLKQELKQNRAETESIRADLNTLIKDFDTKLAVLSDSLDVAKAMIGANEKNDLSDRESAKLNQTILFMILVAMIIALVWLFQVFSTRIKSNRTESDNKIIAMKEETTAQVDKLHNDFQSQLLLMKDGVDKKTVELEKRIREMTVKH